MASVGELLRAERERQGLSLAQIADRTRIKHQYLEALESDDFESLPGRFFARSFTHQYANVLGVNTPELQARLQAQVAPVEIFSASSNAEPSSDGASWGGDTQFSVDPLPTGTASALNAKKLTASVVMLVAAVVACGTIFWLWQSAQLQTSAANTAAPAIPTARKAEPKPKPALPETVSPPAAQPTNGDAKVDPANATTTPAVEPAVAQTPAPPTASQTAPVVPGRLNLTVTAREDVWLRIRVDGKVITERKLDPGESVSADGLESASVFTGNAGGLQIRFNGADIGSVGPRGQVRTVDFTREAFKIVEPQKKAPATTENRPTPVALL